MTLLVEVLIYMLVEVEMCLVDAGVDADGDAGRNAGVDVGEDAVGNAEIDASGDRCMVMLAMLVNMLGGP